MSAKKRVASDDEDDSSSLTSLDEESPVKTSKKKKKPNNDGDSKTKKSSNSSKITGPNGEELIDLTGKKFVSVNQFKSRIFVNIREYYEDSSSGKLKPSKKGIALNRDQWIKLKSKVQEIDDALENIL